MNDYHLQVIFSRKPTFCSKILYSLQGQSSGFYRLMAFLNLSKSLLFFRLPGTRSHIFGSRFKILSVPWYTMFIHDLENWEFWKLFLFIVNISFMRGVDRPLLILYISVAKTWIFSSWIETEQLFLIIN